MKEKLDVSVISVPTSRVVEFIEEQVFTEPLKSYMLQKANSSDSHGIMSGNQAQGVLGQFAETFFSDRNNHLASEVAVTLANRHVPHDRASIRSI